MILGGSVAEHAEQQYGYQVAVPVPLPSCLDYTSGSASLPIGQAVKVKVGRRQMLGVITQTGFSGDVPQSRCAALESRLDYPLLPTAWVAWMEWLAYYYQYFVGEVVTLLWPEHWRSGHGKIWPYHLYTLTEAGQKASLRKPERQKIRDTLALQKWSDLPAAAAADLQALVKAKYICKQACQMPSLVCFLPYAPYLEDAQQPNYTLSKSQKTVLNTHILPHLTAGYRCLCLEGATGSGKTEVYLQSAAAVLRQGRQVLILVPEIGLVPQTIERITQRFGTEVACYHSGMTAVQRAKQWLDIYTGRKKVVVGTRSAIFLPLTQLGLVVIDESHDQSYKQDSKLRYHARDAMIALAKKLGIMLILGSATPSSETLYNCQRGRYHYVSLGERVSGLKPKLNILEVSQPGLSDYMIKRLQDAIAHGRQALLYINRRGSAQTLWCPACRSKAECPRCDNNLTLHAGRGQMVCHICNYSAPWDDLCASCHTHSLVGFGVGTEAICTALAECMPDARVLRVDSDALHNDSIETLVSRIHRHECDIVVGTQMLVKGHHFPKLDLVGILDIDSGILSHDFRSLERTIAQIFQVSGRAGREAQTPAERTQSSMLPEVVVHTQLGQHAIIQQLGQACDYQMILKEILRERSEFAFPPFTHVAVIAARAHQMSQSLSFLAKIKRDLEAIAGSQIEVLGPAPAPRPRQSNWYHAALLVRAQKPGYIQQACTVLRQSKLKKPTTLHWHINIDPWSLFV